MTHSLLKMNHGKQREILAVVFVWFAVVGLLGKAGLHLPIVSDAIVSVFRFTMSSLSALLKGPSSLRVHLLIFQDPIVWCVASSWFGIASWLWSTRHVDSESIKKIPLYYYLFVAALIPALVFSLAFQLDSTFKIGFYGVSFALSLLLGFLVGRFWSWAQVLSGKDL